MYNIILTLIITYFITSVSMGMASARDQIRAVMKLQNLSM